MLINEQYYQMMIGQNLVRFPFLAHITRMMDFTTILLLLGDMAFGL